MAEPTILTDTAANWAFNNPTLEIGQIGVEIDVRDGVNVGTGKAKLGDGVTKWADLPYWSPNDQDGDVTGAASSTANAVSVFADTTGKVLGDGTSVNALLKRAVQSLTSTATAAGTTTLTVDSNPIQVFTGATTQTVVLPVVTTLPKLGFQFWIINNSSGAVTVNSSGGNLVQTVAANSTVIITCVLLTGTGAASWSVQSSSGGISGLTANYFPYATGATTIANSPFSWNGTLYTWNNTALNSEFTMEFTPSTAAGRFQVGDFTTTPTIYFSLDLSNNTISLNSNTINATATSQIALAATNTISVSSPDIQISNGTLTTAILDTNQVLLGERRAQIKSDLTDIVTLGDVNSTTNNTRLIINDSTQTILGNAASSIEFSLLTGTSGIAISANTILGDVNSAGNNTLLTIDDAAGEFAFSSNNATALFDLMSINNYQLQRTITPAATTGDQTINKPAGTVNFAAAATSITVTNSLVTADSLIFAVVRTDDTTAVIKNVVARAGAFVINLEAAATAETSVGFVIFN